MKTKLIILLCATVLLWGCSYNIKDSLWKEFICTYKEGENNKTLRWKLVWYTKEEFMISDDREWFTTGVENFDNMCTKSPIEWVVMFSWYEYLQDNFIR